LRFDIRHPVCRHWGVAVIQESDAKNILFVCFYSELSVHAGPCFRILHLLELLVDLNDLLIHLLLDARVDSAFNLRVVNSHLTRRIRKCPDENGRLKIVHAAHPFVRSLINLCSGQLVTVGFKTKLVNMS
jgi:hypothetical protein